MMKRYIKIFIFAVIMIITVILLSSCDSTPSVDNQIAKQQELQQRDQNNQIGLPDIKNWTEKKLMKYVYELRDNAKLICYAYTRNDYTGKYVYEGRCMGYGLPYATQYSNPEKIVDGAEETSHTMSETSPIAKPQSEPNGLFMPSSAAATWIVMINESTGKTEVQYYEPNIVVSQTKKPARLCEPWSLPADY
jgi:hypothetical protein